MVLVLGYVRKPFAANCAARKWNTLIDDKVFGKIPKMWLIGLLLAWLGYFWGGLGVLIPAFYIWLYKPGQGTSKTMIRQKRTTWTVGGDAKATPKEIAAVNNKRTEELALWERLNAIPTVSQVSDPQEALQQLAYLEVEVRSCGKSDYLTNLLREIDQRSSAMRVYIKLKKVFKESRRILIEDFCTAINMDIQKALPLIYEISLNLNFVIDGKYLELKGEDIDATIAQIDIFFSEWKSREKDASAKL